MQQFLYALVPGTIVMVYFFGSGVVINVAFSVIFALLFELVAVRARGLPAQTLFDGSAVATAILIGLALPPLIPVWILAIAVGFAIVLAKHVYGGLGHNLFNPAMVGYAVVIVAFPLAMTHWASPHYDIPIAQVLGVKNGAPLADGITMATPLDQYKFRGAVTNDEFWTPELTNNFHAWLTINVTFLLSGFYLIYRRICKWHASVAMLTSLALLSLLFYDNGSSESLGSPLFHLFSGASMMGAFFIVSDPVTSPDSVRGQLIFGTGVGILTFIIRSIGAYPEGLAFAILLMNGATPLINYLEFRR